ncbi:MAG: putative oxidoreductase [Cyanobacteria bacterium RYN_339]|nr:putative oxidoreductase [Cyanobacteria bacterium RYN_339]
MTALDLTDFVPEADVAAASTLPARWYVDPGFFPVERERIFMRTWQQVGRLDQLPEPGMFFTTEVAGEPLVILRDGDGHLRALSNVCRHRARTVAQGEGRCKILQCKYHGFSYALDGRLMTAPDFEGAKNWHPEDFRLPEVRLEAWGPLLFVNLDADAPPLAAMLGGTAAEIASHGMAFDAMRFVERREYDVACNWKVFVDNYQEGYHVPVAHPGLLTELDYKQYTIVPRAYTTLQHAPIRQNPGEHRRYESADAHALYYWLFPNFMVNLYPDNMDINLVIPLGPDRTRVVMEWYAVDPAAFRPTFEAQGLAFSEQVQFEDMAICESVQKGLGSRFYGQGRFSPKQEPAVHRFHQLVHGFLTAPGPGYPAP